MDKQTIHKRAPVILLIIFAAIRKNTRKRITNIEIN